MAVMENSIEDHLSRSYHHGTEPLHIPKKFSQCVSNHPLTGRMRGGKMLPHPLDIKQIPSFAQADSHQYAGHMSSKIHHCIALRDTSLIWARGFQKVAHLRVSHHTT